jgi:UPF0755 protein
MTDAEGSPKHEGLDRLFDNLPTAASQLPERAPRDEPAPGTRRAMRAARDHFAPAPQSPDSTADAPAAASDEASPASTDSYTTENDTTANAPVDAVADAPGPADAPAEAPSGEVPATPSLDGGSQLDDLFAPENHRKVPAKKRGRGCLIGLIIVLVVLGGIAAGGAWVYNTYQTKIDDLMGWGEPKDYQAGQATGEALVTIKKGDTGSPVSTALFQAGVTKTKGVFYDYLVEQGSAATFYPGVYKLQKKMTAAAALKALEDPKSRMANTVRIQEGSTVESSLPRIVDGVGLKLEDLTSAVSNPAKYGVQAKRLEGWLFPAVYTFDPGVTAEEVITRMVKRTQESLAKAGVPDADAQRVLTIASVIEREGRTPDFAKISRVIQNRIDDGMMLQMDSTAQYGYGELHAGKASTSEEAQHNDNPWNTYVIKGLPATPISNPGDAAIDAAMHPADGPWLYFVTVNMNTGETQFSTTYEEHQQGIQKMRAWCKANPGTGC